MRTPSLFLQRGKSIVLKQITEALHDVQQIGTNEHYFDSLSVGTIDQ
jgi:hypothetical protein